MTKDSRIIEIEEAVDFIRAQAEQEPQVGIILGSGLGSLVDKITDQIVIPYADIPHFSVSTAIGHKSNLILGRLGGKYIVAMQGRFHYYEGYKPAQVTFPIRVMKRLGIKALFVSNACGALNPEFEIGDLMIIRDHINLMPNPLIGPNLDEFGPRFPDMTRPYDLSLMRLATQTGEEMGLMLRKGVYLAVTGPCYETPHECKFFRLAGADVVGMSTIPEVIVARHCDIPCFGMSVITDLVNYDLPDDYVTDGEAIVAAADRAASKMTELFIRMIEKL